MKFFINFAKANVCCIDSRRKLSIYFFIINTKQFFMKYKFLRISLLSALAVLFGGTALGAFMAAAEASESESSGGETATVSWAVEERPLCATPFRAY